MILVELEEDPCVRLIGNLVEARGGSIGQIDPSSIDIGAPVRAVFDEPEDGVAMLRWILA